MKNSQRFFRHIFVFGLLFLTALAVKAETTFTATFSGAQEVPANSSTATGFGIVTLNDAETQIRYSITFSGLGSNQTAAHIHGPAPAGTNAGVLFDIGSTGATSGTFTGLTAAVTPAQVQQLKSGLWYFNVHSANFTGGEIRGQILPASPFVANLSGLQEVPANSSAGSGLGKVALNASETMIVVSMNYANLGSAQQAAHIHGAAIPGVNAGVLFDLGAPGGTSGTVTDLFFPITPAQVAQLKRGLFYFNVHTVNFPNGEIRGQIKPANKPLDFDGDSRADISVFRASNGVWYRLNSVDNAFVATQWGQAGDNRDPGDFDGDGKADLNVWRAGAFYTLLSATNTFQAFAWGQPGDDPRVVADYDGDGKADYAVYRPGATASDPSFYYINGSTRGFFAVQWGVGGDLSMLADWDGDRINDITVFRTSTGTFYGLQSSNGALYTQTFGNFNTDFITTGDVDGDSKSDPIVFRATGADAGTWFVNASTAGFSATRFGQAGDTPVTGDYDGDGRTDFGVFRGGTWYLQRTTTGFTAVSFGAPTDLPISNYLFR